jgi:5'-phosphate synthase pdxT subunit
MLRGLGVTVSKVRLPRHLLGLDGLVIPGGESSVIDKLLRIFDLREPLRELIKAGLPVFGTCAGLILLADEVHGAIAGQETLGGLDITVARNAFGSQLNSSEVEILIEGVEGPPLMVAFIRAPVVTRVGVGVSVTATLADESVVGVSQGNLMGVSFHPEITGDNRLHQLFVDTVRAAMFSTRGPGDV